MTVDKILQLCSDNNAKFFGLQVLDDAINVSTYGRNQIFLSNQQSDLFDANQVSYFHSPDGTLLSKRASLE